MPTLRIKEEWRDQMKKKKIIIYSWENSVRCLFEVKTDNVIPWNRTIGILEGWECSSPTWEKPFSASLRLRGWMQPPLTGYCPTPTGTDRATYSTVHNMVLLTGGLGLAAKMSQLGIFNSSQTPDTISLSFLFPSIIHYYHQLLSDTGSHLLDMVQRYSDFHRSEPGWVALAEV